MPAPILSFALFAVLAATTPKAPQDTPAALGSPAERATLAKAATLSDKIDRIDLLAKLLPVALTKEQIRAILPVLEKRRAQELQILLLDAAELAKIEAEVTKAVDDAIAKSDVPSVEIQNKVRAVTNALAKRRQVATGEMIQTIYDAFLKILDAGQMKVMANTLKPELIAPGFKVETEEQKIKFFIRYMFLGDASYELLVKMSKPA